MFCLNRLILLLPRIREGKPFSFTASRTSYFPQHSGLSRLDRLVQSSLPKIYEYCGSVLIRPRFFWYDDFIKLVALPSSQMFGLWRTFGFKTSSTESSCIYFYQFPKRPPHQIMSTSTGINKTQKTKNFALSSRHKRFSRFLYPNIQSAPQNVSPLQSQISL